MSNPNDINFKGTDGDAEGHVVRGRGIDDGSGTDAEGRGRHGGIDDSSGTDAEGHGRRLPSDDVDEVEGHIAATQQPGKPRIRIPEVASGDEAEGHAVRGRP